MQKGRPGLIRDAQNMPCELSEAFISYANGDWSIAAGEFASIASEEYENTANYYQAHCLYQLEQYEGARQIFSSLSEDPQYGQQASWFEGLCLLNLGATDSVIDVLETIVANENHFYRDRAVDLLQSLAE
jgi:Tfp pilus assembly protein PilF